MSKKDGKLENKEMVLEYLYEILDPDYPEDFSSHRDIANYLISNKLTSEYTTSTSSVRRYMKDLSDFDKIDNIFTISPIYYKNQYRKALRTILKITNYSTYGLEDRDSVLIFYTDGKNDIIIVELLKKIFPFEAIEAIEEGYRYIKVYFNYEKFEKKDTEFFNSLFI